MVAYDDPDRRVETKDKQTMTERSALPGNKDCKGDQEMYKLFKKFYGLPNKERVIKVLSQVYEDEMNHYLTDQPSVQPGSSIFYLK